MQRKQGAPVAFVDFKVCLKSMLPWKSAPQASVYCSIFLDMTTSLCSISEHRTEVFIFEKNSRYCSCSFDVCKH